MGAYPVFVLCTAKWPETRSVSATLQLLFNAVGFKLQP